MKLTAKEIIGLNSLLDGKEIWGFYESVEPDMDISDKKRIAEKLLEYGEKGLAELLFLLNIYKNADDYVVINKVNIALFNGNMIALLKLEDGYQFFVLGREQIKAYIIEMDNILLFRLKNNKLCGFDRIITENGKKYINSMAEQNRSEAQESEIRELVERYLK